MGLFYSVKSNIYIYIYVFFIIFFLLFRDIAKWINEENAKLKKLATSFTALKNGIENDVIEAYISELKTRIPIPIKFASEGDSVNMLRLYFVCKRHCIGCFYPQCEWFVNM